MTPYDQNINLEAVRPSLRRQVLEHPYGGFVLALAFQKIAERGGSSLTDEDVEDALDDFRRTQERTTSWAGFCYSVGGAILGTGLGAWVTGYFAGMTLYALLPFVFLAFFGLLIIFVGVDRE